MARIVNIINFIRGHESRDSQLDLLEPVVNQIRLVKQHNLPATFLIQYDAMKQDRFVDLLKGELDREKHEIGIWLEVVQELAERAGLKWRGRSPWDWHVDVGFTVGYTPAERERLVDVLMEDFRSIFGDYPASVGSWFIDAHTLGYMSDRYGITASCNCKDQVGTDGYTLWGGYWNQAYYPSRVNGFMPAQNRSNQIPVPVFRMLGSDPIYQYDSGIGSDWQDVVTLEPVYKFGGGSPQWVRWFFDQLINEPCISFAYTQVGQENSFGWSEMAAGLTDQISLLAEKVRSGDVRVETLRESGRWFRENYDLTPVSAVVATEDPKREGRSSIWYDSRFYRVNLLWEDRTLRIRDLHLFDEAYCERYLQDKAETNTCVYDTLPVMDGFHWSDSGTRAGIRAVAVDDEGLDFTKSLLGVEVPPEVRRRGENELYINWQLAEGGSLEISCMERELHITLNGSRKSDTWAMEMSWGKDRNLPIQQMDEETIRYEHNGFAYKLRCQHGRFRQKSGINSLLICPEAGRIVLSPGSE
ncbi:MAG: hypothetical protein K8S55_15745 [Phycisphaerae bacterium]|nr:hypothetical protein [Phycisphaerae bacterium]